MSGSCDKIFDIEAGYRLGKRGSTTGKDKGFFFSPQRPDRLWSPPSLFSWGVKRPCRECDHSLPSSTEMKNVGAIAPLLIRLRGVVLN
jgi:hypothetical protein